MSEMEPGRAQTDQPGQESIDRRAWSKERQWRAAGIGTVVLVSVLLALWFGGGLLGKREAPPTEPPAPAGTFRASAQQLKTLTVESVGVHGFVSEEVTEGKIAVDGDRATPLYSPYSGRVTRVIAGLGDTVKKGAPLATLEASEYVQAQNDLTTAVSQRKLARINETRKQALYEAKGGSLQDWQQAQTDLAAAETAVRSVRNRLKILGRSDSQIDALETAHSIDPVATIEAPIAGVVVDRQVGPGQYLQAGAGTPVFTIADPSSVWLLANVREADSGSVHLGQVMTVHVTAYPKREFAARVTYVAALVDSVTHRLPVRAENRQSRRGAQAGNVRHVPHSDERCDAGARCPGSRRRLRGRRGARVGRSGRNAARLPGDPHRPGQRRFDRSARWPQAGERVVTKGGLFIDQAAASGNT